MPEPVDPAILADEAVVARAVAEVSAAGGFFAFDIGPVDREWLPLADLYPDPGVLAARIATVARRLGTDDTRVAASIMFQGLAARLWSPPIAAALVHDLLIDLSPARVYWRAVESGPLPMRAESLAAWEVGDPAGAAEPLYRMVATDLLEPIAETMRGMVKLAPGLLWGNAASTVAEAVRAVGRRHPELLAKAAALGGALLETGFLKGSGELIEGAPGHLFFVRRSCCLYYRLPTGSKCGDCALVRPQERHDIWARAVREFEGVS
ncbi:Ferric iron reductase protein FhuF, involved in iron transport [Sinosporangium album]|uniref:Ferric iron reductase protein FhuF, involved in iron transport n=1 Tax=Sinosporangium album TaxID=504805 RepID=A0A1G8GFM5_9ACTN|nr:(2Fe-2S)-binding protein [Sinosporangium album]SDH93194.1 Ferric iron reductase protein FhuF, involved in iron transport [Sinosporangium album]